MAGYYGFSKSNNAIDAENRGLMVATLLSKKMAKYYKGCTPRDIAACLYPKEWHHTGKMYNCTDYYDFLDFIDLDLRKKLKSIIKDRLASKKMYPKNLGIKKVVWLEWSGSRSHPVAFKKEATVEVLQKTEITFEFIFEGKKITKREGTNGFRIY